MLSSKRWVQDRIRRLDRYLDGKYQLFERLFSDEAEKHAEISLNKVLFKVISYAALCIGLLLLVDVLLAPVTDKVGTFGDFFGGVLNPILTFFTLFGLIVTIVIQRQELRLARSEYEKTADALGTQAIETTFFNILDLHHKIVDNLKFNLHEIRTPSESLRLFSANTVLGGLEGREKVEFEGRAVFDGILHYLSMGAKTPEGVLKRYRYIQGRHNHILGHYFRNLYQALKVIDGYEENKLSKVQKKKYSSILRAQLSTKELAVLFLNCIDGVSDSGQFKNLLIEYQMLEHLPVTKVEFGYSLAGSSIPLANNKMLLQYKEKIKVEEVGQGGGCCGAFGRNPGVPHDLLL